MNFSVIHEDTPKATYAQRRDMADAAAVLHDLLRPMSGDAVRGLIKTALADSDIAPADLDRLGNELSRMAWEMQRGIE